MFVESALAHAGWRRRTHRAAGRRDERRDARARRRARGRGAAWRSRASSASARRSATRSSRPPIPTPSRSARSSSPAGCTSSTRVVSGAPELWRYGLHLQEETTAQLTALAAELGARPWRELVDELRNDAPDADELLDVYRAELDRARAFVAERDLVAIPDDAARRGRHAAVPRVAGAVRRVRAPADLSRRAARAGSTSPSPTRRCRPRPRRSSAGGTAATASRRWWRTRRIPATISSS